MQHVTGKHSRLANEIIKAAVKNSDDDGETVKKDYDLTALIYHDIMRKQGLYSSTSLIMLVVLCEASLTSVNLGQSEPVSQPPFTSSILHLQSSTSAITFNIVPPFLGCNRHSAHEMLAKLDICRVHPGHSLAPSVTTNA